MLTLPLITLSLLLGRLSPVPAAMPHRHSQGARNQGIVQTQVAVLTMAVQGFEASQNAFSRPPNLGWEATWAQDAARKVSKVIGFHTQNAPFEMFREASWNMGLTPTLLKGGGAALLLKLDY